MKKNFLFRSLVFFLAIFIGFGAGEMHQRKKNNEEDNVSHYLNWYLIGLYDNYINVRMGINMDDEINRVLKSNPTLEEEEELQEKILDSIRENSPQL